MNRFLKIIPLMLLQACAYMYIPSAKNTPLFEKKGEVQIEAGASANSVYGTGSYAFSEKFALIANGSLSFRNFSNRYDIVTTTSTTSGSQYFTVTNKFSHRYAEGGLGRYNLLSSKWKLEIFGGGGYGEAFVDFAAYKNYYWLGFFQGNFGRKWKFIEYGGSLRTAYSGFHFIYPSDSYPHHPLHLNFNNVHIEPLAFFRIGKDSLRGFVRVGFSITAPFYSFSGIKSTYGIYQEYLEYNILHLSVGLSYRFK